MSVNFKRLPHAMLVAMQLGAGIATLHVPMTLAEGEEVQPAGLEEIIVTAQKREERLQDVPISVTAFDEKSLDNMVANSIGDIDRFVPNLSVSDEQVTQPGYSIRGIGTSDFGIGLEPAVGVYIDGVYVGRSGASRVSFNDVERVEVLNGPQGTLFGRNAAAGAIQVITNKPVEDEEGWVKATLGNYNKVQLEGVYNLPLADNLYFRGGALYNDRDGWIRDVGSNPDRGDEHNWSVNGAFRWQPREDLDVIFRLEYDDIDQTSQAQSSATLGIRDGDGPNFDKIASDGKPIETRELWGSSVNLVWNLDGADMTSITSYRGYNSYNRRDMDGTDIKRYFFDDLNDEDNEQFSQEIRFASSGDSAWHWTAGANYFWEHANQVGGVFVGPQAADQIIWDSGGGVADTLASIGFPGYSYNEAILTGKQLDANLARAGGLECDGTTTCTLYPGAGLDFFMNSPLNVRADGYPLYGLSTAGLTGKQLIAQVDSWLDDFKVNGEYQSYAVFGDLAYDFNQYFTLTGGLRWTKDEKKFGRYIDFDQYGVPLAFQYETLVDANGNYQTVNGTLQTFKQEHSWDEVTGRVVLDYHVNDDVLLYASWATGYKSGGYNSATSDNVGEGPLDNENVENKEVGIKSTFFDNRLRVNAAYFDYVYENLQAQVFIPGVNPPSPPCTTLGYYAFTTDDVDGSGYELSVTWLVIDNLTLGANTGKLDAEYTRSERVEVVNGKCVIRDRSGDDFASSPSNYNLFANYELPMESGATITLSFNYSFIEGASQSSCTYVSPEGYVYGLSKDPNSGELIVSDPSAGGPPLTLAPGSSCPDNPNDEYATARASYLSANGKWEFALYAQNLLTPKSESAPGGLGASLASSSKYWDGSPTYSSPQKPEFYGAEFKYIFQ